MRVNAVHPVAAFDAMFRSETLASLLRLNWFIRMRWVMVGVALAALAIEQSFTPGVRRPSWLYAVVLLTGVINLVWMIISRNVARDLPVGVDSQSEAMVRARRFAIVQISTDLLLLTLIVRFAGGVEGLLAIFYLFHMGICALLLSTTQALIQGFWAVLLFSGMAIGELFGWIRPHYEFLPQLPCTGASALGLYVFVAIVVHAMAVFGTLYFTLRIALRIGEQERQLRGALQALCESREAIKELQARRTRFMMTAAHQLKSPLAAIQTMAILVRDGYVKGEGAGSTVERIIRRSKEAIVAVGELITLARVQEADPQRHIKSTADVCAVLRDVGKRREAEARSKGLSFVVEFPENVALWAKIAPLDLAACVDNLVDNAIKFTPGPGRIVVTARSGVDAPELSGPAAKGGWIEIAVSDTGIGIAEVDLGGALNQSAECPIFDAFRRGNTALEAGISGSGLGLSIVREIIEQAGGDVRVRSQLGNGSVFTVRLPMACSPAEDSVQDATPSTGDAMRAQVGETTRQV